MKSQYAPNGSLQFNARSARSDTAGWAAIGRRFDKPIDISNGKTLAFWLHGDASGSTFKVQLRDVKGIWHDMTTSVSFNGWKYVEFNLAGAKLDLKQVEYILYYYNGLPAGRTIDSATTEVPWSPAQSRRQDPQRHQHPGYPDPRITDEHRFPAALESGQPSSREDEVNLMCWTFPENQSPRASSHHCLPEAEAECESRNPDLRQHEGRNLQCQTRNHQALPITIVEAP